MVKVHKIEFTVDGDRQAVDAGMSGEHAYVCSYTNIVIAFWLY